MMRDRQDSSSTPSSAASFLLLSSISPAKTTITINNNRTHSSRAVINRIKASQAIVEEAVEDSVEATRVVPIVAAEVASRVVNRASMFLDNPISSNPSQDLLLSSQCSRL